MEKFSSNLLMFVGDDHFQVAKCFGFQVPPFVDLGFSASKHHGRRGGGGGFGGKNKKQFAKTKIYRPGNKK